MSSAKKFDFEDELNAVIKKVSEIKQIKAKPAIIKEYEVIEAFEKAGKDKAAFEKNAKVTFDQYMQYLSKYGAVGYFGFEMSGNRAEKNDGTECLVSEQREFKYSYKLVYDSDENINSCWIIARTDEPEDHYIDASKKGKGCIYALDFRCGTSKFLAKDFIGYLEYMCEYFYLRGD